MKPLRTNIVWFSAGLAVICLALLLWSGITGKPSFLKNVTGAVVTPLQKAVSQAADWFSDAFGYFYRYDALQRENEELREELQNYKKLENQYYSAIRQNTALREAAGIKAKRSEFDLELGTVVSVAGSGFQSAVTLDRGSLSGVEEGDAVITGDGLVGFVSQVGLSHCTVTTVINADFTASAVISRTREVVVAQGNFDLAAGGELKVAYLENDADVRVGDTVVTSGGSYPPDLILGTVTAFAQESHGISSYAAIQPAVELGELSTVFIIKDFSVDE